MRLPKKLQASLVEKCKAAARRHADRFCFDSYFGQAHRQGSLEALLDKMLPPFAAELSVVEGIELASLARKIQSAKADARGRIEERFREIVLRVAARIPCGTGDWNRALDSAQAVAVAFYGVGD